jgi:hypothetical protein
MAWRRNLVPTAGFLYGSRACLSIAAVKEAGVDCSEENTHDNSHPSRYL